MIRFEQKKIRNTTYFYLSERIPVEGKYKKIQVFLGKSVPTDMQGFFAALANKERAMFLKQNQFAGSVLIGAHYKALEQSRIDWKYFVAQRTQGQYQKILNRFAISFIYESNAIEGSRLSQMDVAAIVQKQYVKKSLPRPEVKEAENAIKAFEYIQGTDFSLTQKQLKQLHAIVVDGLNVPLGFKKESIVVNNKKTADPRDVRTELQKLFAWYKNSRGNVHPFERAVIFHNRFEHIHPFTDGNGRIGRLILNWMLLKDGYGVILFKNQNRKAYFSALDKGDEGRHRNILTLATKTYQNTISHIIASEKS